MLCLLFRQKISGNYAIFLNFLTDLTLVANVCMIRLLTHKEQNLFNS